jgi:tetratricopeptide (TPR) repeat protein
MAACDESAQIPEPWMVAIQAAQQASQAKQTEEAESGFREALRLATEAGSEKGRMNALDGLAATHSVGGKMVAADSLYRVLLDLQRRRLEVDSLSGMVVARTLGSLGQINLNRGEFAQADSFFNGILELDRGGRVDLRPEEPALAYALQGRAEVLAARGQTEAGCAVWSGPGAAPVRPGFLTISGSGQGPPKKHGAAH